MNLIRRVAPAVLAFAIAAPASAQITTYSSRSNFNTAAGPVTTESFNQCGNSTQGLGSNQSLSASSLGPCSSLHSNMTFAPEAGGELYISAPGQSSQPTTALGVNVFSGYYNQVSFGSAIRSFGADLWQNFGGGSQSGNPAAFTATVLGLGNANLGTFNFNVASGTGSFWGFTSTVDITAVRIAQSGGFAVMDDVSIGNTSVVPEPSTYALMAAGLAALGVASRRRRRTA